MGQLIDIMELSKRLSIPTGTLYNWVSQKRIPFVKIGRRVLFDLDEIEKWVEKMTVQPEYEYGRTL